MIAAIIAHIDVWEKKPPSSRILSIGLGGSTINNFLHDNWPTLDITVIEMDPVIHELARAWFGLKEDERHRVVIEDGVQFLQKTAGNDQRYDYIVLDACDNAKSIEITCPSGVFMDPTSINNMQKLLQPNGVLMVNVLPLKNHDANWEEVGRIYGKVFANCFYQQAAANKVLICPMQKMAQLTRRMDVVKRKYGFQIY